LTPPPPEIVVPTLSLVLMLMVLETPSL
jgi:hypothetical protein